MRIGGVQRRLLPWAGRRHWQERAKLTAKAVLAAVVAWTVAHYLVGHAEPYFAPLGVYPSVVRSVRESIAYAAGFVIGAAPAIPVGILIGPNLLGIAVVLVFAMMASGWRRLGGQSSQVAFTALFALLLGGPADTALVRRTRRCRSRRRARARRTGRSARSPTARRARG